MASGRREDTGFRKQPLPKQSPAMHEVIGRKLRQKYEETQPSSLPNGLSDLLDLLDKMAEEPASPRRN